jgi:hypothetical protein
MDLDLERFWAVVRPHRRKPAPKPTLKKQPPIVWIEAVDSLNEACTERVPVSVKLDNNNDFVCEVEFPASTQNITIMGFRMYSRPDSSEFRYIECAPREIMMSDNIKLNLLIKYDVALKQQLVPTQ